MTGPEAALADPDVDLIARLAAEARAAVARADRIIVGIAGAPGAGKSTLGERIVQELDGDAILVGMDGFHFANSELARLGRRDRKGAPNTFDVGGYVSLLRRLRARDEPVVYAPRFDRALEESIGSAIPVPDDVPIVVTEGNYLLLESGGWESVASLLDLSWYVEVDEDVRLERLIARHMAYGRSAEEALAWSVGTDQRNAEVIVGTKGRATRIVRFSR